jgi:hypothetical protein
MISLGIHLDVVSQCLELDTFGAHVLREFRADPPFIPAFVEQVNCIPFAANLLPVELSVCGPVSNPPNATARFPLPNSPNFGLFLCRHIPSGGKYHLKYHQLSNEGFLRSGKYLLNH